MSEQQSSKQEIEHKEHRTPSKGEHLALLKEALAANIEARKRHEEWLQQQPPKPLQVWWLGDMTVEAMAKYDLEAIVHDPELEALRAQLRKLGKELFRLLGSTDAMLEVAEEIAKRDPPNWDWCINLFDKNWDGLGNKDDIWAA